MFLTLKGITVEAIHPADVARLKQLGYVEAESVMPKKQEAVEDFAASQQAEVESALQPEKVKKAGKS